MRIFTLSALLSMFTGITAGQTVAPNEMRVDGRVYMDHEIVCTTPDTSRPIAVIRHEEIRGEGLRYAYVFPGLNKVIQSVGRLIRSHQDKGIVILAGERFAQDEINLLLPAYWFEKTGDVVITEDYERHIRAFWERFE